MKPIRIAALVVIGAAVVALAGVGRPDLAGGASEPSGGITVTGTGTVQSVPDQAQFSLGVQTNGPTARGALAANSERMRRVLAALFAAGVAKGDVQTQDVSVSKSYPDNGYSAGNSYSVGNAISNTTTQPLYQSCRWNGGTFQYQFAVANVEPVAHHERVTGVGPHAEFLHHRA
jgi:hypothetical protein